MITSSADILACPADGQALKLNGRALICPRGHNYDLARNGYCNLLLAQHKSSLDPGDSNDMVIARRRFLNAGHYAEIAERIYHLACTALNDNSQICAHVVDAGCGEGYYLESLASLAQKHQRPSNLALAGMDISKWAVKAAASRAVGASWVVASNRQPPFLPHSVDLILNIFGFPHWGGFSTILSKRSHVLLVDPGPEHLIELRRIIYPTVREAPPVNLGAAEQAGFSLEAEHTVHYEMHLETPQIIQDLLLMTPHHTRIPRERRMGVAALEQLSVTVDVVLRLVGSSRQSCFN